MVAEGLDVGKDPQRKEWREKRGYDEKRTVATRSLAGPNELSSNQTSFASVRLQKVKGAMSGRGRLVVGKRQETKALQAAMSAASSERLFPPCRRDARLAAHPTVPLTSSVRVSRSISLANSATGGTDRTDIGSTVSAVHWSSAAASSNDSIERPTLSIRTKGQIVKAGFEGCGQGTKNRNLALSSGCRTRPNSPAAFRRRRHLNRIFAAPCMRSTSHGPLCFLHIALQLELPTFWSRSLPATF